MRTSLVAALLLIGCAHTQATQELGVAERAQVAMGCSSVRVFPTGAGGYLARGCGRVQSYTCTMRGYHAVCVPDESPHDTSTSTSRDVQASASTVASLPAEDVRIARAATTTCATSGDGFVTLDVGPAGEVVRVETPGWSTESATCIVLALRGVRFSARASAQHGSVDLRRAAPSASAEPPPVPGETQARAYVTSLRDVILACAGAPAVAVLASWTADGALTLRLPDDRAGTAQDGCVRAAASGAMLSPAPGVAGSVLHAVH